MMHIFDAGGARLKQRLKVIMNNTNKCDGKDDAGIFFVKLWFC